MKKSTPRPLTHQPYTHHSPYARPGARGTQQPPHWAAHHRPNAPRKSLLLGGTHWPSPAPVSEEPTALQQAHGLNQTAQRIVASASARRQRLLRRCLIRPGLVIRLSSSAEFVHAADARACAAGRSVGVTRWVEWTTLTASGWLKGDPPSRRACRSARRMISSSSRSRRRRRVTEHRPWRRHRLPG